MKAYIHIFTLAALFVLLLAAVSAADNPAVGGALTLKDCINTALRQSPLIKSSEFDIEASSESVKGAKGAMYPRLDLGAAYFRENRDVPYIPAQSAVIPPKFSDEVYSWSAILTMPVYEGGRLSGQVKVSELENAIQSSRRDFTVQDVVANVTNTFNKLLQLKELKKANVYSVQALESQKDNTELLVKAGRAANVELLRVEVQLASEKQNLVKTEEAINRAGYALGFLMGVKEGQVTDVSGNLTRMESISAGDVDKLIMSRPDVVAARKRVQQEKARVDIASGKRYPTLSLVGDYGNRAGAGLSGREEVWEAGAIISVNIFDAGIISSEIGREKALYHKSKEELRLLELRAKQQASDALSQLREADSRFNLAGKALAQSEETLRIEQLKYKTGAGTITDVLLAESAMSEAQANYYQALYDYNAAITEFKRATGTIEVKG
ncbi:MAG: TolC family protein [Nitrospiraceae bacterium]|nr:TolC family protein [Nitrospiraceae bacterium]